MTGKESFFKAHWDWLLAILGIAALGGALAVFMPEMSATPDDAAHSVWTIRASRLSP